MTPEAAPTLTPKPWLPRASLPWESIPIRLLRIIAPVEDASISRPNPAVPVPFSETTLPWITTPDEARGGWSDEARTSTPPTVFPSGEFPFGPSPTVLPVMATESEPETISPVPVLPEMTLAVICAPSEPPIKAPPVLLPMFVVLEESVPMKLPLRISPVSCEVARPY